MICRCHPSNRCGRCDEPAAFDNWWLWCASWLSVAWAMTEATGYRRNASRKFERLAALLSNP